MATIKIIGNQGEARPIFAAAIAKALRPLGVTVSFIGSEYPEKAIEIDPSEETLKMLDGKEAVIEICLRGSPKDLSRSLADATQSLNRA